MPVIKAIGRLARTFPARETRIISPLVLQLGDKNVDVATEAAIALGKFVCPKNFNCLEHYFRVRWGSTTDEAFKGH